MLKCWKHYFLLWWSCCCCSVDIGLFLWVFCRQWWWGCCWDLEKPSCHGMIELLLGLVPPWWIVCVGHVSCCVVVVIGCFASWMTNVSSIYPSHKFGVCGTELRALTFNSSINSLAMRGLMGEPWQHHRPVCNTYLGRGTVCFWGKTPGVWHFVA